MVNLTGPLAKLLKKTKVTLISVDDDSSKNTDLIKCELKEKIRIKGSNPLPNGKDMYHTDDNLFVAADDITLFMAGCKELPDGTIVYEGPLKWDVSKPKGRMENGAWAWKQGPRLWLLSVPFNRRGSELIQSTQDSMKNALNVFFVNPEESVEELKKQQALAKLTSAAGPAEPPKEVTEGIGAGEGRNGAQIGGAPDEQD